MADPAADSIIAQLRKLEGFISTEYEADTAVYRASDGVLRLRGQAEVRREGDRLNAESIIYRDRDDLVEAYGAPRVTGQSQELSGDTLYYDLTNRRASVLGARTKITQEATWFVTGQVLSAVGNDRIYASHAQFTTCDLEIPHYHFESGRIKVVKDKLLVAAPARLYFGKVPVLILPFVVQHLEKGRRSGLLVPRFGVSDIVRNNSGYTREIQDLGWYWAINDYLGGQVAGTWRSGAYVSLAGNLTFNSRRRFLNGNAGFTRYWQASGERDFGINSTASWRPDERTNLGVSANYISSPQFIRRTTIDPREATQDLTSTVNISRRFDWGTMQLGSDLRKSISNGGVTANFPSFSISPNTITFFRDTNLETARWYNNASFAWNLNGTRTYGRDRFSGNNRLQNETETRLQGGITQLSFGNLNLSATGALNQRALEELIGTNPTPTTGQPTLIPASNIDVANWDASISYRIPIVGQTSLSPNVSFSQQIQRDSLTGGRYLAAPRRMSVGAGTNLSLFRRYPGFGPYSALRHRLSPTVSYGYAPEVKLTPEQLRVFGASGGYAQNRVSLGINQTWEAKLRSPSVEADPPQDSAAASGDSTAVRPPSEPSEPEKVTLLSINTSSVEYDFVRAAKEGTGFVTTRISNSITSDYLRGLTIQMSHELFNRTDIDPNNPAQRGQLGTFAPRLESLSTGFDLGPSSAIFRWIGLGNEQNEVTQGEIQGRPPTDAPTVSGTQTATNNPRGFGGGAWRMSLSYAYSRPPRSYIPAGVTDFDDRAVQTVDANIAFPLTPGWGVNWNTSYSLTDREFGSHRLNFQRDLHRWQANFSFYQTPTGNTAFEFFVNLIDNPDIKFDHRETNLGIDR
ncbi:MAG: hypothetical protein KY464_16950 [Gemmatimonadetes bacterium]|nr:hypothetical protein [Gemmatimonadota bacterium]